MDSAEGHGRVELSAVVVGYNSSDHIGEMIKSLQASLNGIEAEVIVVDNASADDTHEVAAAAISRGRALRLEENVGYGRGANAGIAAARGRLCLILNDDVIIDPESLRRMIDALDSEEDVRLVAPRMVSPAGKTLPTARRYLPGLRDEVARIGDFIRRTRSRIIEPSGGPAMRVDFVLAACLLGESSYLRTIGGFSDAYFMYGEDIDLCRRVKSMGDYVVLAPDAQARHDQAVAEDRRIRGKDFSRRILDARNAYYRTWLPRWERALINLFRAVGPSDQPFRLRYHFPKAIYDGPSLRQFRRPDALVDVSARTGGQDGAEPPPPGSRFGG